MNLMHTFIETFWDVMPIILVLFGFQIVILKQKIHNLKRIVVGFILVWIGLALLILGLEKALFPLGKLMATQLTSEHFIKDASNWASYYWIYILPPVLALLLLLLSLHYLLLPLKPTRSLVVLLKYGHYALR